MAKDYRNKQLVYHLTALDNLPSILAGGLLSRSALAAGGFVDVADHEIIDGRRSKKLEEFVPFHFFSKTPFDYAVYHKAPDKPFVLIGVRRTYAKSKGWKIVPSHPLSGGAPKVMEYDEGFAAINWDLMESESYKYAEHSEYRQTCMAECLSPDPVTADAFLALYVRTGDDKKQVEKILRSAGLNIHVNVMPTMFPGRS